MKCDKYTVIFGYLGYFLMMIPFYVTMSESSIFIRCPEKIIQYEAKPLIAVFFHYFCVTFCNWRYVTVAFSTL